MTDPSPSSDAPWLDLYPGHLAPVLTAEFDTALELFEACVRERPDHPALWYLGRSFSYAELDRATDALGGWLAAQGLSVGDRVAVILQNCPEFLMAMVGAWKVGAVPIPMNPMYRSFELAKLFADADPRAIVCGEDHRAEVEAAVGNLDRVPPSLLTTHRDAFGSRTATAPPADGTVAAIVAAGSALRDRSRRPRANDLGLLLYTSGTTGAPKGAMLRHSSLAANAQSLRDWCDLGTGTRILAIAPFFHITGVVCHLLAAMSARATVVTNFRFEPGLVLEVIRETRPTFTIGAITAFNALMTARGAVPEDFSSFEQVYSGGAPIPPALVAAIETRIGLTIYPSFGMTETTAPTHLAPFGASAPVDPTSGALSIGIPTPSTDAIIVDEAGRELIAGDVGELLVRGPQIMAGYWRKPEESAETLRGGWMHTGDVGFRDQSGWFYLVDRKKDMIIASGYKVWPREVEDVLYGHPAVREAAVVGVADSYRGETVKAFVSFRPGAHASEAELIAHCREALAAYKAPRSVEVLDELPKTITGKIQRVVLRALAGTGR